MDSDLLNFLQNVSLTEDSDGQKGVTIAIEIKEMLEENNEVTILVTYDQKVVNKMHIRRKNDK